MFFLFPMSAKPAKRQAAAQPVHAAVAQPVVAPVAPNGKAIICHPLLKQ